jgi:hypothetical protein
MPSPTQRLFSQEVLDHVAAESIKNSVFADLFKAVPIVEPRFFAIVPPKPDPLAQRIFRECKVEREHTIINAETVTIEMRLKLMDVKLFPETIDG